MVRLNAMAPASDITSYMMRRIAQREVCDPSEYTSGYGALFVGMLIAVVAWHTLQHNKPNAHPE